MARKSDKLHELIKSLSPAEKRYFKIDAARHQLGDGNSYVQLFDALDKQKTYNEDALKKKFAKTAFINRLSIAKRRLYNQILKSLRSYHSASSHDIVIQNNLHEIEILFKKSLYSHCESILKTTRKLAIKHELFSYISEINRWEKWLIEKDNYAGKSEQKVNTITESSNLALRHLKDENDLWLIKSKLLEVLNHRGKARSTNDLRHFYGITDKAFDKLDYNALSLTNKFLFNHINSAYYFAIDEPEKCEMFLASNKDLYEQNQDTFQNEANLYIALLSNLAYVRTRKKDFKGARSCVTALQDFTSKLSSDQDKDLTIKAFSSVSSTVLSVAASEGTFKEASKKIPKIVKQMNDLGDKVNPGRRAFICFLIARIQFGLGDYNGALKWINQLLNDLSINKSEDMYCFAQILYLIIHLELGHKEHIPHAIRSVKRYLTTRKRNYRFESIFLKFIQHLAKMKTDEELPVLLSDLSSQLAALRETPYENTVFDYFDFHLWADAKVSGKSFPELVKKQASS